MLKCIVVNLIKPYYIIKGQATLKVHLCLQEHRDTLLNLLEVK